MAEYGLYDGERIIEVGNKKTVRRVAYDLIKKKKRYKRLDLIFEPNQEDMASQVGYMYWDPRHGAVYFKDDIEESITQVEPDGSCHY